ncbi:MAG: hypothetical protein JXR65_00670 [Bacteroidales bacterium]|nr:hypothetical protein [Bacteroidales bacterium]
MSKYNLTISFLIFSFFSLAGNEVFAQNINQTDAQGRKQGKWVKEYTNGAVRYKGQFKNNMPYGTFTYYFPTGSVKAVSVYSNNGNSVYTKTFRLSGKKLAEGKFVDRKKDSTWTYYDNLTGNPVLRESYIQGLKNGKSTIFFPDSGKPSEIQHYKKGVKTGLWIKYFPNGTMLSEGTYVNDTLEGPFKINFPNGITELKGSYNKGLQEGLWITSDSTGVVVLKQMYHRGVPVKK